MRGFSKGAEEYFRKSHIYNREMRSKYKTKNIIVGIVVIISIIILCVICCGNCGNRESFQNEPEIETIATDITSPIKVFLYADKLKATARVLLSSLKKHKFSYEVLGLGKPWEGWVARTREYLSAIRKYKADNGGSAVALFIDAYDVICIMDSDKFYEKYMNRVRTMPVIFGAEQGCTSEMCNKNILNWYDHNKIEGGRAKRDSLINSWGANGENLWSQVPTFTNNGTMMGTADGLEFLFTEILKTEIPDDQVAAGSVIANNFDKFDIDFEEALFRNRFRDLEKRPDEDGVSGPGFLHFHAMRTEVQQTEVLKRFQNYM